MLSRLIVTVLLLVLMMPLVTGCWNRKELNELGITSAIGFDYAAGRVRVTAQVIDPGEISNRTGGGTSSRAPVTLYEETAGSVMEAIRAITTKSPRKVYLSHLRVVIIDEKLAREGMRNIIDFLSRDHELRRDFFILVAQNTTSREILNILTTIEKIPANKIYNSLKVAEESWAPVFGTNLETLVYSLVTEGLNPLLPGIRIEGDPRLGEMQENVEHISSPARLTLSGLAVFRGDRLVGWMKGTEGVGANFIMNKVKSTVIRVACPETKGNVTMEIIRSQSRIKSEIKDSGPSVRIEVMGEANVADVECQIDLSDPSAIKELEQALDEQVGKLIKQAIASSQHKFKSDVFGFGNILYRQHPRLWQSLKGYWKDKYPKIPTEVDVKISIRRTGTVTKSFITEIKE
ncbi:spore germination protein KC [Paenibacillus sp. UNCCL117]|uniref:Ger(x)C family spore germination protein n=1 Tax=unclassified Paenibacillus TaxID=185978 RepID=UPI0008926465|nr:MULTISPECIES: Ger(x)C family spore germination protein [unclassified Paenibacillus]SDE32878.1 spore germination protein KC [Paenibacillus sp. cl123]SFW63892.1 spore germination protein KC [Paenibacillus sp. UNCCL117]